MVLNVPSSSTFSGITLVAPLPSILPKATTVGVVSPNVPFNAPGFIKWLLISSIISDAINKGFT